MPHQNIVFHDLLKLVPWHRFDAAVEEHGADARIRQLSTHDQFVALVYGQLSGASSLREIITALESHSARHLIPKRTTVIEVSVAAIPLASENVEGLLNSFQ